MKTPIAALCALALLTAAARASPPTAEQRTHFFNQCIKTSHNETLCTCKADAAVKLVDADFMDVIIRSMSGRTLDPRYNVPYNDYIVASTRACGMGM